MNEETSFPSPPSPPPTPTDEGARRAPAAAEGPHLRRAGPAPRRPARRRGDGLLGAHARPGPDLPAHHGGPRPHGPVPHRLGQDGGVRHPVRERHRQPRRQVRAGHRALADARAGAAGRGRAGQDLRLPPDHGGAGLRRRAHGAAGRAAARGRPDRVRHAGPRARPPAARHAAPRPRRAPCSTSATRCSRWASRRTSRRSSRRRPPSGRRCCSRPRCPRGSSGCRGGSCATPSSSSCRPTTSASTRSSTSTTRSPPCSARPSCCASWPSRIPSRPSSSATRARRRGASPSSCASTATTPRRSRPTSRRPTASACSGACARAASSSSSRPTSRRAASTSRALSHVFNYTFPEAPEIYVHRTGRTGRAGKHGTAVSLIGPTEVGSFYYLKLLYKIRPEERALPSETEIRSRREGERVSVLRAALSADPGAEWRGLGRRLTSAVDGERLIAALLARSFKDVENMPALPKPPAPVAVPAARTESRTESYDRSRDRDRSATATAAPPPPPARSRPPRERDRERPRERDRVDASPGAPPAERDIRRDWRDTRPSEGAPAADVVGVAPPSCPPCARLETGTRIGLRGTPGR